VRMTSARAVNRTGSVALASELGTYNSSTTVERIIGTPYTGFITSEIASRNQRWERAEGEHWSYAASSMIVLRVSAPSTEPASHRTMCQPGPSE